MLTKSGAKLLDFGLAKLELPSPVASGVGGEGVSAPATRAKPLTGDGTMLGTFQYMAPEQLEGKPADVRTDIFALGSVLYEMATGHRAFEAKSQASLIVAILEHEPPPMTTLQPLTPPDLERLVKVCLAKDPDDRLQTAHDVMQELKWIAEAGASPAATAKAAVRVRVQVWIAWAVAGALAVALLVALKRGGVPAPDGHPLRLRIAPPEKVVLGDYLALSPDGRRLAFPATDGNGKTMIWVQPLDAEAAAPLPGSDHGGLPFWSPDGRELAFFADGKLKRVDLTGGSPQTICEAADGRGGTWSPQGQILYTPDCCSGLFVVPASGGVAQPLTTPDPARGELSHRWPQFLPGGRQFLYLVRPGEKDLAGLYLGTLDSPQTKRLADVQSIPSFQGPDRLFYVKEGRLVIGRLDLDRLAVSAETSPVAENVRLSDLLGLASFTTSAAGLVAYRGGGRPLTRLTWFDRTGRQLGFTGEPGAYELIALAPNDRQVAVSAFSPGAWSESLWLLDTRGGQSSRFTFEDLNANGSVWSADASRLLFNGAKPGEVNGFYQKSLAGSGAQELLFKNKDQSYVDDWSADSRYVVYEFTDPKTRNDIGVLPLFGDRKPQPFLATPANEAHARLSPDGQWIAYTSDALGRSEVFVQPFPAGPGRWQVSTAGGDEPIWRRDSKELFYLSLDRKIVAVAVRGAGGRFEASPPQALFSAPVLPPKISSNQGHYGVSADGQRIFVNALTEEAPAPITLLVNWTPESRKAAP
jgi:Tol biopolymer transport system component